MKKATSELVLPDVNVLLALVWPNHQFHAVALRALEPPGIRWATCALTELSFIRLFSNPSVVGSVRQPSEAVAVLAALVADAAHIYLEDSPSPAARESRAAFQRVMGHQQVTDSYLLFMARRAKAVFLTFDKRLAALAGQDSRVHVLG